MNKGNIGLDLVHTNVLISTVTVRQSLDVLNLLNKLTFNIFQARRMALATRHTILQLPQGHAIA